MVPRSGGGLDSEAKTRPSSLEPANNKELQYCRKETPEINGKQPSHSLGGVEILTYDCRFDHWFRAFFSVEAFVAFWVGRRWTQKMPYFEEFFVCGTLRSTIFWEKKN